jgi:Caspase domain
MIISPLRSFYFQKMKTQVIKIKSWAFILLAAFVWCFAIPSWAQPVMGTVYKDFLPMGSDASVPLPEGLWAATQVSSLDYPGANWAVYTLKNQQANAKVPLLVVRQTTTVARWANTTCFSQSKAGFMLNEHETLRNHILNKCSRVFVANYDKWRSLDWGTPNDKKWWADAVKGMPEKLASSKAGIFLVELSVHQFNGKNLRVEAFVLPPKGTTAAKFRDEFNAGQVLPEHDILSGWTSIYIESMQQSFFNKKPQPIMALAYLVGAGAVAASASVPSVSTPAAAAPGLAATPSREESGTKPVQSASAPVPVSPVTQTTVVVVDNSAQLRMEEERRAMDEEKRKMAKQLETMTQMLAKLQQENAKAIEAAKAKEAVVAIAEPIAQPREPVTYANRKALVIGNDLYTHVPKLHNAGADAEAMAKSLESVGYKVFKYLNLDEKKFKQVIRDFRQNLSGGDEVLFFYAGHGVQLGNANYLLPTDVQGDQEDQVKDDAILLQKVLDDLEEKKTKFALAVIDACRDNPFKGKGRAIGGRGLAPTSAATGQMIMFSAGSGQQALDRLGDNDKEKNGLFTRIFVKEMTKPGFSVDRVLRNVRNEVVRLARSVGHEQTPALYDQAVGEFYFRQ